MYGERAEPGQEPGAGDEVASSPRRVLVVDHDADLGACVRELVMFLGHREVEVSQPDQALAVAARLGPDIIVLDVGQPGGAGLELASRLRRLASERPLLLIALTSWSSPNEAARAAAAGVDHYLQKPVGLHVLRRLVGRVGTVAPVAPAAWAEGSDAWRALADLVMDDDLG